MLVTGAVRGIGQAVVAVFEAAGARCLAADLAAGDSVLACDVANEESVRAAFDAAAALGPLTDVVHAAGIVSIDAVVNIELAEFRRVLDVNLTGSFLVGREAARRLEDGGTITLISSQAGLKSGAYWASYAAAKAGVIRLAEALARELGPRGIRANAICPRNIQTPMADAWLEQLAARLQVTPSDLRSRYVDTIPLGRFGSPEEIASVCVFLASPLASFVSGTVLHIDGGELSA